MGIGFATPSNIVTRIVSTGEYGGRIVRPWLGITMQRVTPDLAAGLNLPRPAGLVVKEVFAGGPGDAGGLQAQRRDHRLDATSRSTTRRACASALATLPVGEPCR